MRPLAAGLLLCVSGLAACSPAISGAGPSPVTTASLSAPVQSHPVTASCSGCHSSLSDEIASLDRYSPDDLAATLRHYRDDANGHTVMHRIARGLSDTDIATISADLGHTEGGAL